MVEKTADSWDLGWAARKGASWADQSGDTMVEQMVAYWVGQMVVLSGSNMVG